MSTEHPFDALTPDTVIDAIESTGRLSDLRIFALNCFAHRVYQVSIEGEAPLIVKFYRPGRWSDASILEEHAFSRELLDAELPVIAPLVDDNGQTLLDFAGFRFTLFPRIGGHVPELDQPEQLLSLGRILGRMHAIGASRAFSARPRVDIESYAQASFELIEQHFIPAELKTSYVTLCESLLGRLRELYRPEQLTLIRSHGDLHPGNILCRDGALCLVDLDDCRSAPAMQDIWMLLSGERPERMAQLTEIVDGYEEFHDFPASELPLIEPLRTLRLMHYAAWLAARWHDPAFPKYFPWFNTPRYWSEHVLELREQLAALDEEPLRLYR
ncbi:MAG: serine/threonine protein kinase [Gammaproteobacteria bacterium]|nr:serine/threonine protein kinase [Gammaproteobacteria bacterium]